MMEAFRFIHTSQLRLDQQLSGLRQWHGLDRPALRDCTFRSFARVVDACLANQVDLLLITGECWAVDCRSVRAAFALQQSCLKLAAAGITVCLAVTDRAQFEEGLCGLKLPETAVVLDCGQAQEFTVAASRSRRARLQTMLRADVSSPAEPTSATSASGWVQGSELAIGITDSVDRLLVCDSPFSIVGGVPLDHRFDYIAARHPGRQRTLNLGNNTVHSPGPTQGLTAQETGSCGCTLVEWTGGDEPRLTHIPTAPFRWEQWAIELSENETGDSLRRRMLDVARQQCGDSAETAWLVRWNLSGDRWPDGMGEDLESTLEFTRGLDREIRASGVAFASQSLLWLATQESEESTSDPLWKEFDRLLDERFPPGRDSLRLLSAEVSSRLAADRSDVERVLSTLSPVRVANEARATGRRWLVRAEAPDA